MDAEDQRRQQHAAPNNAGPAADAGTQRPEFTSLSPPDPRPRPWLRLEGYALKAKLLRSLGINGRRFYLGTVILASPHADSGHFSGEHAVARATLDSMLASGHWTGVRRGEDTCVVVVEPAKILTWWQTMAKQGREPALSVAQKRREALGVPSPYVACVVDYRNCEEPNVFSKPLARLCRRAKAQVRSGHKKRRCGTTAPKLHAGWGKLVMAGLTFRPGNGKKGACPGVWKYSAWERGVAEGQQAQTLEDLMPGLDADWRWLRSAFPPAAQALVAEVQDIPLHVLVNGCPERTSLSGSPWCCLSGGCNYYAAPHTDRLDLHGAVIRFVDHGFESCTGNEFFMPDLGVVMETPSMCVVWCSTARVKHGTMPPVCPEASFRLATARQLKKNVVSHLRRQTVQQMSALTLNTDIKDGADDPPKADMPAG